MPPSANRFSGLTALLTCAATLFAPGSVRAAAPAARTATPASRGAAPSSSSASPTSPAAALRLTPVGRYDFASPEVEDPALVPEELSGLVRLRGNRYLAIGDEHACLHRLTIDVDPQSGKVRSASIGAAIRLRDERGRPIPDDTLGLDREGLALAPDGRSVWIANERTGRDPGRSSISMHRLSDGRQLRAFRVDEDSTLKAFTGQRTNLGFESLTRAVDGAAYWTSSEGPLSPDGPRPTDSQGGFVRLLRLDRNMRPKAQFAYPLDPYRAPIAAPPFLVGKEVSGLSELLALPGSMLALERTFAGDSSGNASLRIRIYAIDLEGATDVSGAEFASGLHGKEFQPVGKRLLWGEEFGLTNSNFEGMALGPKLSGGDRTLLLIADNNGGASQALYALRLRGAGRIPGE